MKYLFAWFLWVIPALAVQVGDSYEQVIAEKGKPKSQASVGANRILNYPDGTIQLRNHVVEVIKLTRSAAAARVPAPAVAAPTGPTPKAATPAPETPPLAVDPTKPGPSLNDLQNQRLSAVNRLKSIINQPAKAITRTNRMVVSTVAPGWFPEATVTPDFNRVDVRKSQELPYDKVEYVTSDLNPKVAYVGPELEFNPMTKLFYTDLSVPKRKLTEEEMIEVNRLYRIIGRCDTQIRAIEPPNL